MAAHVTVAGVIHTQAEQGRPTHVLSLRDLQGGAAAGCQPHLVRSGKVGRMDHESIAHLIAQVPGTQVHADLAAFVEALISHERHVRGDRGESDSGYGRLE